MRLSSRTLLALLGVLAIGGAWQAPAAATTNSFLDDDNSRFEPFIETAREQGLVHGCNPPANTLVCPHHRVTRGSMAIMLARALGVTPSRSDHFVDDDGHVAEAAIDGLIDAGIPMGCDVDRVCPDRVITRGEMAALMARAFQWGGTAEPGRFVDLGDSPFGEPSVKLADRGGLLACDVPLNRKLCPGASVRRDEAMFALVTAMDLQPKPTTPAESDLPSLGFGDGFTHLSLWDGRTPSSRNRVKLTDSGYRNSGLRVDIPKGSHYGADFHLHLEDASDVVPDELYFRYYVKFDEDWRTTSSGKLPGFSGVYGSSGKGGHRSSASEPGWSARLMFGPNHTTDDRIDLGYYVYHLGQETRYGDGLGWNEAGKLNAGEWYCLEGAVEMNGPGLADGALRAWVDGTPAFELSGLEFRRPSEPEIVIESFWFNVYYGGKAVAPQDLGLTIDEVVVDTQRVGCGTGEGTKRPTDGDFDGDGYADRVWWDTCPGGTCFWTEKNTWSGKRTTRLNGDGAWFSLDSHRLGLATGDVDGDGRTDIVYHGRCDDSISCWRVHHARGGMRAGDNWGDGARFSDSANTLLLGDWNGDGRDDLVYQGSCGDNGRSCWRAHVSSGEGFEQPADWGPAPGRGVSNPVAVDATRDGRDDLVFQAPCDESLCWFLQASGNGAFEKPTAMGLALESADHAKWLDFDGDGDIDLISWANSDTGSWIEVRYLRDLQLGRSVSLASLDRPIHDVALRRVSHRSTVQAVVETTCEEGERCVERLMSPSPDRLIDSSRFRDERWDRPGGPYID